MNILLAEDEKQLSHALVTAMQATGYHVDPAYNGQEAVDLAGQRAYDVIILDIMMPKLNGIEALKQLRQEERLCRKIAEHSLEVQQHLTEARRDRAEQQKQEQERARDRRPNIDLTL